MISKKRKNDREVCCCSYCVLRFVSMFVFFPMNNGGSIDVVKPKLTAYECETKNFLATFLREALYSLFMEDMCISESKQQMRRRCFQHCWISWWGTFINFKVLKIFHFYNTWWGLSYKSSLRVLERQWLLTCSAWTWDDCFKKTTRMMNLPTMNAFKPMGDKLEKAVSTHYVRNLDWQSAMLQKILLNAPDAIIPNTT